MVKYKDISEYIEQLLLPSNDSIIESCGDKARMTDQLIYSYGNCLLLQIFMLYTDYKMQMQSQQFYSGFCICINKNGLVIGWFDTEPYYEDWLADKHYGKFMKHTMLSGMFATNRKYLYARCDEIERRK
jgi:hypothetical protein